MSDHQDAANLAIKRRIQDSINRAHQLLLDHEEENAHTEALRDEYWSSMRRPPITIADLTPTERSATITAAQMALHIIDNDEQETT